MAAAPLWDHEVLNCAHSSAQLHEGFTLSNAGRRSDMTIFRSLQGLNWEGCTCSNLWMLVGLTWVVSEQPPWLAVLMAVAHSATVLSIDLLFCFPRPPHSLSCLYIVKLEELNQADSQQGTLILNRNDIFYQKRHCSSGEHKLFWKTSEYFPPK